MAENTYGDISLNTAGGMKALMLRVAAPQVITARFGQTKSLPRNSGKDVPFTRYHALTAATAPLVDGVNPSGQPIRKTDLTIHMEEYGDFVPITSQVKDLHTDDVLRQITLRSGDAIAETVEKVNLAVLKGGTSVFYANGVANRAALTSGPKRGDLRKIVRFLRRQRAKPHTRMVKATTAYGTEPIAPAFVGIMHVDLIDAFKDLPGFTPVEKYSDSDKALPFEVGKLEEIRFCATTFCDPWKNVGVSGGTYITGGGEGTGTADSYPVLITGQDAYATIALAGKGRVTPTVRNPKPQASDELGRSGSIGWSMYHTCGILNQLWMTRYECCALQDPS